MTDLFSVLEPVLFGALIVWLSIPALAALLRRRDGEPPAALAVVGLVLGVLWGAWRFVPFDAASIRMLWALAIGGLVVVTGGCVADVRCATPRGRLCWELGAAVLAGLCLPLMGVRLGRHLPWGSPARSASTVLWVVTISYAFRRLEALRVGGGTNGLCAGLAAVAAWGLMVVNLGSHQTEVAALGACLGGACAGYLPYAWRRSGVALGSAGSLLVGFALAVPAAMGVYVGNARVPALAVLTPFLLFALPLLNLAVVAFIWWHRRHRGGVLLRTQPLGEIRVLPPHRTAVVLLLQGTACAAVGTLLPTAVAAQPLFLGAAALIVAGTLVTGARSMMKLNISSLPCEHLRERGRLGGGQTMAANFPRP